MTPPARPPALTEEEKQTIRQLEIQDTRLYRQALAIIRRLDARVGELEDWKAQYLEADEQLDSAQVSEIADLTRERDALRAVAKAAHDVGLYDDFGDDLALCSACRPTNPTPFINARKSLHDALAALDRTVPGWRDT